MLSAPRTAPALPTAPVSRLRSLLPSLLVAAVALGYVALDLWGDEIPATVPGEVPPLVHAGLVLVQALALLAHRRRPLTVFGVVVAADLVVLATTVGQLGIGALGVILATYMVAVRTGGAPRLLTVLGGAVATTVVGSTSMVYEPGASAAFVLSTTAARVVVLYVLPAVAAAYARDRERLRDALDAQERLAERQRQEDAERQVRHERAALARELHDIAGHHLSSIIVGAQAATALLTSDPERARTMLRTVQDDARITLGDLRQTVGLLRDDDGPDQPGQPSRVPTLAGIEHLAEAARERGQEVRLVVEGDPRTLGPLAEATAYRTVQESLTNAARHAPGAACHVTLAWTEGSASVTVHNAAARLAPPPPGTARPGHGLAGMAERAELVGARLTTGPARDGGWTNQLVLATDGRGAS